MRFDRCDKVKLIKCDCRKLTHIKEYYKIPNYIQQLVDSIQEFCLTCQEIPLKKKKARQTLN